MIPDYTKQIWSWFKANTKLTDAGISAVIGNMWAESTCEPCRRQGDFSDDRHISKEYAAQVDCGNTDLFFSGKYGWGLCQWTFPARCRSLYNFCKSRKKSIADLETQLEFVVQELKNDYSSFYELLCRSQDVKTLSDRFMTQFEIPYDQSDGAKQIRSNKANEFYNRFHGSDVFDSPVLDDVETPPVESLPSMSKEKKAEVASKLEQVVKLVSEVLDSFYEYF